MRLIDCITQLPPTAIVFADSLNKSSAQTLLSEHKQLSDFLVGLGGKSVALQLKKNAELAKWLIYLDGLASKIVLLPPDLEAELNPEQKNTQQSHFIKLAACDLLITDTEQINSVITSVLADTIRKSNESAITKSTREIPTEWLVATSGTSSMPKLVSHTLESLTVSSLKRVNNSNLVWGLLYDLHRFAGIQVFLQALIGGNTLVVTESDESLAIRLKLFAKYRVNCLSATPTLWRKMLLNSKENLPNLNTITLGGETADDTLLKALSEKYPHAKIRHIYASSEAGVGFSVSDRQAGFPAEWLVKAPSGITLRRSDTGTLLIKSAGSAKGYIGTQDFDMSDGFIDTGDLIAIEDDRCVFKGRLSGGINVGGNKVHPEVVEDVLMSFEGVLMAKVSAKSSPITGDLVQAEIVIDEGAVSKFTNANNFIQQLRDYCQSKLVRYMVPALIRIVDDIPVSPSGKIIRR